MRDFAETFVEISVNLVWIWPKTIHHVFSFFFYDLWVGPEIKDVTHNETLISFCFLMSKQSTYNLLVLHNRN